MRNNHNPVPNRPADRLPPRVEVSVIEGAVILTFDRDVSWISLDPDTAAGLAACIAKHAMMIKAAKAVNVL